mmetsp:Transcript_108478/g.132368  ORF Transcript_108478/g.132368 Transcript_108478/m.132368 type:complete len:247 (-) Transcript_108478:835-1575(-)
MDGCAITFLHLVKLIDAADAHVCQDQRAAFQRHLARGIVAVHRGRQAHSGGALARGVHRPGCDGTDLLQQLTLGHTRVAHHQGMDVATDLQAILHLLGEGANEHQQQSFLHILVSKDLRCNGLGRVLVEAAVSHGLIDLVFHGILIRGCLIVALLVLLNVMRLKVHGLRRWRVHPHLHEVGQVVRVVNSRERDGIARQDCARKISLHQDRNGPWHTTLWHVVRHLLHLDLLVLGEGRCADVATKIA